MVPGGFGLSPRGSSSSNGGGWNHGGSRYSGGLSREAPGAPQDSQDAPTEDMKELQMTIASAAFIAIMAVGVVCTCLFVCCGESKKKKRIYGDPWRPEGEDNGDRSGIYASPYIVGSNMDDNYHSLGEDDPNYCEENNAKNKEAGVGGGFTYTDLMATITPRPYHHHHQLISEKQVGA